MKEEWRDVVGYEGLYQVSNLGRVKSFIHHNGTDKRIIKTILIKNGYCNVTLCKKGKRERKYIHRLVAEAFIPNPNNYPIINHKDENPANNCSNNLEWCTQKYNMNYGSLKDKQKRESKSILQYDLNNNFIKKWDSIAQAEKELNITHCNIISCLYKSFFLQCF